MKRLDYFRAYEAGNTSGKAVHPDEQDNMEPAQNGFGGISPDGFISLFEQDVEPSEGGSVDIEGAHFTMCSTKLGLWNLQSLHCNLLGLYDPFANPLYSKYLRTLPKEIISMMRERFEFYNIGPGPNGPLLIGINDTIRILQARMGNPDNPLYYIVYPGGGTDGSDIEMTTSFDNTMRAQSTVDRVQFYIGKKIYGFLRDKFRNFTHQQ
ncbi:MAG: hypothetical protein ACLQQ4_18065 [Bacteroidia bacterium]